MRSSKGCVGWLCALVLMTLFTPHCPCYARPSPTKDSFRANVSTTAALRRPTKNETCGDVLVVGKPVQPLACEANDRIPPSESTYGVTTSALERLRVLTVSCELRRPGTNAVRVELKKRNKITGALDSLEPRRVKAVRSLGTVIRTTPHEIHLGNIQQQDQYVCVVDETNIATGREMEAVLGSVTFVYDFPQTSIASLPIQSTVPDNFITNGTSFVTTAIPPSTPPAGDGNASIPANDLDFPNNGCTSAIVIVIAVAVVAALLFVIVAVICVRYRLTRRKRPWHDLKTPVSRASVLLGTTRPASTKLLAGATDLVRSMSQAGEGEIKPWNSSAVLVKKQNDLGPSADDELSLPADADFTVANPVTLAFTPRAALPAGDASSKARSMSLPAGQKPPINAKKRPKSVHFRPDSFQAVNASSPSSPQSPPTTPQSPPAVAPPQPQLLESTTAYTGRAEERPVEEGEHQARQHQGLPAQGMGRRPLSLRQPGRQPIPGRAVPERTQSVHLPAVRAATSQYPARQCRSQPDVAAATVQTSPASPSHIYNGTDWPWPLEIREAVSLSTLPTNHPALCASQPFGCSSQLVYVSHVLVGSQQQVQQPHQHSVQSVQGDQGEDQLQEQPPPAPQRPSSPPPPPPPPTQQPADDLRFECPVTHGNDDVCFIPVGEWSGVCVPGYYPSLTAVTPEPGRYWPGGYAYPASLPSQPLSPVAEANVLAESTLDDMQQSA